MLGPTPKTPLVVADSDTLVREGLSQYLSHVGFEVFQAGDAKTALSFVPRASGAVLDVSIPTAPGRPIARRRDHGLILARRIKMMRPAFGIVLFSAYEDHGQAVLEMLSQGYLGIAYQLGGSHAETLIEAIRRVLDGGVAYHSPNTKQSDAAELLLKRMTQEEREFVEFGLRSFGRLTVREQEVARLWASSHSVQSIAARLQIESRTVENYNTRIYDKLGLQNAPRHLRKSALLTKVTMLNDLLGGPRAG